MKSRILIAVAAVLAGVCFGVGSSAAQDNPDDVYWDNSIALAGGGLNGAVTAMTVYDGKLIVAGEFTRAGGIDLNHIAAWDGSSWSGLGTGVDYPVISLAVHDGELIAAFNDNWEDGFWPSIDTNGVLSWNGTGWTSIVGYRGDGYHYRYFGDLDVYNGTLLLSYSRCYCSGD